MFFSVQKTIKKPAMCQGIGVHSNEPVCLSFLPAPIDHGIVFVRKDLINHNRIPANYNLVKDARFCTVLTNEHNVSISTVEHIMAALAAYSVTNLIIEVSGPEVPIMDGSSNPFIAMIEQAGIYDQNVAKPFIRVLEKVEIMQDKRFACIEPAEDFSISFSIDFNGRQNLKPQSQVFFFSQQNFCNLIAQARSFGFLEDAQKLWDMGLARGSSLENAVVIDQGSILNPEGLRNENEMVCHKILDALGDLALAGMGIQGRLTIHNGGHEMNNNILRALLTRPEAFEIVDPAQSDLIIKQLPVKSTTHLPFKNLPLSA